MNILYLSGFHPVLEYDECLLLEELGFNWFSTGVYHNPKRPVNIPSLNIRKPINKTADEDLLNIFRSSNPNYMNQFNNLDRPRVLLTKDFVTKFDLIFSTSVLQIKDNWELIKNKPIIWRTVGSINNSLELQMKPYVENGNIHPIRFSNQEFLAPDSNGGEVIKNYVDENIYKDWKGYEETCLSFQSWFTQRRSLLINKSYLDIYNKIPAKLYGAFIGKTDPISNGCVSWEEQINLYKKSRCYFYIGSNVGVVAYNFLEAMMTGSPIITYGPELGGFRSPKDGKMLHEASELIEKGVNGFYSDNLDELANYVGLLVENHSIAKNLSKEARNKALKMFSKKLAINKWKDYFNSKFNIQFK